jgi:hypothetical protein
MTICENLPCSLSLGEENSLPQGCHLFFTRKLPLRWLERVGVRGDKMEIIGILIHYNLQPFPPLSREREKAEFPDMHWFMTWMS